MGNSQSHKQFFKLHCVIPPVHNHGGDNPLTGWLDKTTRPFASEDDRKQFMYATLTVITENGAVDLREYDFRLLYSRRKGDRLVARLVAEKEGVIKTQIVASEDGKNQIEAFLALRRHIEMELDRLLSGLPAASALGNTSNVDGGMGEASRTATRASGSASPVEQRQSAAGESQSRNGQIALPSDAPPAYGKAVKEWRTDEKKR